MSGLGRWLEVYLYVMFWLERENDSKKYSRASTVEIRKTTDLFLSILEAI